MAVSVDEMLVEIMMKLDRLYAKVERIESKIGIDSVRAENNSINTDSDTKEVKPIDVKNIKQEIERKRKEIMDGLKIKQLYNRGTKK